MSVLNIRQDLCDLDFLSLARLSIASTPALSLSAKLGRSTFTCPAANTTWLPR